MISYSKNKIRVIILFFLIFIGSIGITAQGASYLLVNLTSGNIVLLILNEDFKIENFGKEILIDITGQPTYVSIEDIESLGFLNFPNDTSSMGELNQNECQEWKIYDISGNLIREIYSTKPDFKGLKQNEIYIVKGGNQTFKYFHIK